MVNLEFKSKCFFRSYTDLDVLLIPSCDLWSHVPITFVFDWARDVGHAKLLVREPGTICFVNYEKSKLRLDFFICNQIDPKLCWSVEKIQIILWKHFDRASCKVETDKFLPMQVIRDGDWGDAKVLIPKIIATDWSRYNSWQSSGDSTLP